MFSAKNFLKNRKVLQKRSYTSSNLTLKQTALHPLHVELGAKMAEFAGYDMPISYPDGILSSHLHCRNSASLFDVSHMAQLKITGKDRVQFLESICVSDLQLLPVNHATLSVYTNTKGGIIDDTIITNRGDHFFIVVNAGCADKDIAHYKQQISQFKGDVKLEVIDKSLIALQGPLSQKVLQNLVKINLNSLKFMSCDETEVDGTKCLVSRCGYTGEDGFEISVPHDKAISLARKVLNFPEVKPAGLGPRDSLRLEAGLCLYGHDMDESITPVEASLSWTIGRRRKEQGGFLGSDIILAQLKNGVSKKRVGFIVTGAPARDGCTVHDPSSGKEIGKITSGTFSPILKQAIGMGYIETSFSKLNTNVHVQVRGKNQVASVSKMPFVPTNYKKY